MMSKAAAAWGLPEHEQRFKIGDHVRVRRGWPSRVRPGLPWATPRKIKGVVTKLEDAPREVGHPQWITFGSYTNVSGYWLELDPDATSSQEG